MLPSSNPNSCSNSVPVKFSGKCWSISKKYFEGVSVLLYSLSGLWSFLIIWLPIWAAMGAVWKFSLLVPMEHAANTTPLGRSMEGRSLNESDSIGSRQPGRPKADVRGFSSGQSLPSIWFSTLCTAVAISLSLK